jgi:hypothetical protein
MVGSWRTVCQQNDVIVVPGGPLRAGGPHRLGGLDSSVGVLHLGGRGEGHALGVTGWELTLMTDMDAAVP